MARSATVDTYMSGQYHGPDVPGRRRLQDARPRQIPLEYICVAVISEAALLIKDGPDEDSTIPITRPLTRLGRAPFNDVVVDASSVSRHHADIHAAPDGYRISDVSSRNGTFVNGTQIEGEGQQLRDQDRIELGGCEVLHWVFKKVAATVAIERPSAG